MQMLMLMPRTQDMQVFPVPRTPEVLARKGLAVLVLVGVTDRKSGDPIGIYHSAVDIQECLRSITALLSVHANNTEANALVKVVVESDALGKVGAGVESARALIVIDCGSDESVLVHPIRARCRIIQTGSGTIACRVDTILEIEVDHGNDTGNVDSPEVSHTASIVGWSLELRELSLGDLALADGVVIVLVVAGEDVEI